MSRVLPAAAAAVLILAACGSSDADTPADDPVDTLDPGDIDDADAMRAPSPIEITRGSGTGNAGLAAESATADASTTGAATSDMMIAPVPWVTEFVVADSMPNLPTNAVGYVYDNTATVAAEQIEQLAATLGVEGDAVRSDDGYQVSWRVGPDDGSAPSLWVAEDAQLSWNYNGSWDEGIARSTCAVSVDADGTQTEECDEPEPPVGVPTPADAEARVRDLLVELGEDPDALVIETFGDEWFASVSVSARLDGGQDVRYWNFGFGAEGVMQHAGGTLARPAPVGPYPLVDLETAVARLGDSWFGGHGGFGLDIAVAEPAIAVAEAPPVDIAEGDVEIAPDDEAMPVEPMPDPMPEPEAVTVTLVDVEADLWWAWDVDGSVWLLPAYRFIDADGGWYTAPAVTDEFMIQVEPPIGIPEPMPVEPAPEPMPAPEPVEPEPDPGQDPGEPIDGTPPDEGVVEAPEPLELEPVTDDPDATIVELNDLLPLKLEEFIPEAELFGFSTRVVMIDGESLAVTMDFRTDRINVEVKGDRVVAVQSVG